MCKTNAKPFNLVIISCYDPNANQSDESAEFYSQTMALKQTKLDDIVFILGYFNTKVRVQVTSKPVGKY